MRTRLSKILFGKSHGKLNVGNNRVHTLTFPSIDENNVERIIKYRGDDGLILYLLKRIEKLEDKVK